ncbi:MAG: hypothetical protein ACXVJD_15940 [Mucilaginibacter sp.]
MINTRFKKVLLVAPEVFPNQLIAGCTRVKHISATSSIFPSIYDMKPEVILFDYEYLGDDMEKILRRIQANAFYNKIKIGCLKNTANRKTDSLLKTLGVDYLVYRDELAKSTVSRSMVNAINSAIDITISKWAANVNQ